VNELCEYQNARWNDFLKKKNSVSLTRRFWENILVKQRFFTPKHYVIFGQSLLQWIHPLNSPYEYSWGYHIQLPHRSWILRYTYAVQPLLKSVTLLTKNEHTGSWIRFIYKRKSYDVSVRVNYSNKFCNSKSLLISWKEAIFFLN